jgi:hypothetical protein
MNKFSGFQAYMLKEGLAKVSKEMKDEIRKTIEAGNNPIMTEGYVDMMVKESLELLDKLTYKR